MEEVLGGLTKTGRRESNLERFGVALSVGQTEIVRRRLSSSGRCLVGGSEHA